jgi:hypothetical protein
MQKDAIYSFQTNAVRQNGGPVREPEDTTTEEEPRHEAIPEPAAPPGWHWVTAPDGARYRVLYDRSGDNGKKTAATATEQRS